MAQTKTLVALQKSEENKLQAEGYVSVPGNKSRRYYNPSTHQEIGVRQYQKLQKGLDVDTTRIKSLSEEQVVRYNTLRAQNAEAKRLQKYYRVVEAGKQGKNVTESLKAGGLSKQSFEKINAARSNYGGYSYEGNRPVGISTVYEARWIVPTFDQNGAPTIEIHSFDQLNSRRMGQYHEAVRMATEGHTGPLKNFGNNVLVDTSGNIVILPTNVNAALLFANGLSDADKEIYDSQLYELVKGTSIK